MLNPSEILNATILIVDDQKTNVMLLEHVLSKAGYTNVSSTMNPLEVCDLHRVHQYDLILLDLQMPEMDGFQVMEGLKEIDAEGYFPVLVITAQPNHKLRALQCGAKDFISKPFDLIEVQTRIHNMLEVRLLYQQLNHHNELLEQIVLQRTEQLRASEARFKSFTELMSDWYWEQDAEGNFTTVSGPVFEMLGIDSKNKSNSSAENWNSVERAALQSNIESRRPFLDFVYAIKKPNGELRHLQVSGEPMFDSTSRFIGYRGVGVEITGHPGSDLEKRHYWRAMNAINIGVCLINPDRMQVIEVNDEMCRLSGFSRSELNAFSVAELNIGSLDYLTSTFNALIGSFSVYQIKIELRRKDGSTQPALVDFRTFNDEGKWIIVATFNANSLMH